MVVLNVISENTKNIVNDCEKELRDVFEKIDEVCEYNSLRVLNAFHNNRISDLHFGTTTGYGYGRRY